MASSKLELFQKRRMRVRNRIKRVNEGKLRLSIHRSNKNISAQLIDDAAGRTLASASTLEPGLGLVGKNNVEAAAVIGRTVAERAVALGHSEAFFDRGGFLFHGKVKALAEAARDAGLKV